MCSAFNLLSLFLQVNSSSSNVWKTRECDPCTLGNTFAGCVDCLLSFSYNYCLPLSELVSKLCGLIISWLLHVKRTARGFWAFPVFTTRTQNQFALWLTELHSTELHPARFDLHSKLLPRKTKSSVFRDELSRYNYVCVHV